MVGEGESQGPFSEEMLAGIPEEDRPDWTTLGEWLKKLEAQGVSTNIASFVGATTIRVNVLGHEDRAPNE